MTAKKDVLKRPPPELFQLRTDTWTKPFWDAAGEEKLLVARCGDCGECRMPPTPFCPHCQSQALDWLEHSGEGSVFSYTIVSRAIIPGMEMHLPYAPAVISLDGLRDIRIISNVVDINVGELAVDLPVSVVWDHIGEVTMPRFTKAS